MAFSHLFKLASTDLAIDLGTANTVVYARGRGIVINEPSVVAMEMHDGVRRVRAVGADAKLMMGKTPAYLKTIRPLRNGVIADLEVAEQMIKHFIHKANGGRSRFMRGPQIVICVPSGSTQVERRAIRDAASNAGASSVSLLVEPIAAAIGAGLSVITPTGSLVVDIGGGTTEVGVISLKGLTYSMSARVGGDKMDDAIAQAIRRNHGLLIGDATAEKIKKELGTARVPAGTQARRALVRGRDVARGVPREIEISQDEMVDALRDPVGQIMQAVRRALENTAPEIAADIIDGGIMMTGGGSLLPQIDGLLADETGLQVTIADNPLMCVALGAGRALEDPEYAGTLTQS